MLHTAALFLCLLAATTQVLAVEFSGRYKSLLFQTQNTWGQQGVSDLNRLRLKLDAGESVWHSHISYDHELLWGDQPQDALFQRRAAIAQPTWVDTSAIIRQSGSVFWQHQLYRAWLAYEDDDWRMQAGRQRLSWGSGRIWNPSDRFNPVEPTALEPSQKLGVDAVVLERQLQAGSASLMAVYAPQQALRRVEQKTALRWRQTFGEADVALMAGRIGTENIAAFDVTGNIGDVSARIEWMQAWHGVNGSYGQLSVGVDGNWVNDVFNNGLYLALEYFYNGAASRSIPPSIAASRLQSITYHQLGGLLGYDLSPLWRLDVLTIGEFKDASNLLGAFVQPSLRYSWMQDVDVSAFIQYPQASNGSFAALHTLLAMQFEWYF